MMKCYCNPQMEILAVMKTDVIATSLNIMSEFGGGSVGNVNVWDWSTKS